MQSQEFPSIEIIPERDSTLIESERTLTILKEDSTTVINISLDDSLSHSKIVIIDSDFYSFGDQKRNNLMVSTGFFRLLGGFPNAVIYYNLFDFLAVGSGGYYTLTDSIFLLGNALDGFGGWLRARLYPHGSMFHGYYIGFAYEKSWITYTNKSLPTAQDDAYEAITVDFGHHSDLGYHFSISQSIGIDYTIHVSNAKISSHHTATESAGMHLSLGINLNYAFSL